MSFDGLSVDMSNLHRIADVQSRSICPENLDGSKGGGAMAEVPADLPNHPARELGKGWKVQPYMVIPPGETFTVADIEGPGAIQQIWMTITGHWRFSILRIYWDDQEQPSVECPVGDFFASGWCKFAPVNSLAVCVNPGSAFNCYWTMPFRKRCRITLTNINPDKDTLVYYQVNYALGPVGDDAAYFHAQFRRSNPLAYKQPHVILAASTWAPTWPGASITSAGGARGRSSSTSTATSSTPLSAAPEPRTISAAATTSRTRPPGSTRSSAHPTPACRR
jgi:hypothetical protein